MVRCFAITAKNEQCLKNARAGSEFCGIHQKGLVKVKVGQEKAVTFHQDEGGIGLLKELWLLMAKDLDILQIRPLMLTCKTLFGLFANDDWFTKQRRYFVLACSTSDVLSARLITSKYQDEVCKGYTFCNGYNGEVRDIYRDEVRCLRIKVGVHFGNHPVFPLVHVVKNYLTARWLYKELKYAKIIIQSDEGELHQSITRLAAQQLVKERISSRKMDDFKVIFYPGQDSAEEQRMLDLIIEEITKKDYVISNINRVGLLVTIKSEPVKKGKKKR